MQCSATNRKGQQCGKPAIDGGTVCRLHGGAAPQVQDAARRRLATLVVPALSVLEKLVRKRGKLSSLELAAARDVLDRNGLGAALAHRFVDEQGRDRTLTLSDLDKMRAEDDGDTTP